MCVCVCVHVLVLMLSGASTTTKDECYIAAPPPNETDQLAGTNMASAAAAVQKIN